MKKSHSRQSKKKKPLRPQKPPEKLPAIVLEKRKLRKQGNREESGLITAQPEENRIYLELQDELSLWIDKYEDMIDFAKRIYPVALTGRIVKDAAREGGKAKKGSADERHEEWQQEAARIAKEQSEKNRRPLTKIELARRIARKTGGKVDTIRRVIKKPT
ncbi:MAG TPA: hypothetical protein PLQ15_00870 [Syntrophales bacterium]|nr:hypothetical protein [Syntrophales bacterium]